MKKRNFKPEDLYAFNALGAAQTSPDGKLIAYVVKEIDEKKEKFFTNIFIADVEERTSQQVTYSNNDRNPVFSPDGKKLAFISSRTDKSQIWILPLEGGEAWCLKTNESVGDPLIWTPDGRKIIYTSTVEKEYADDWTPYAAAPNYDKERLINIFKGDSGSGPKANNTKVITSFTYKLDEEGETDQVFITSVPATYSSSWIPESRQVTFGDYNHAGPTVSPDGRYVVVNSNHAEEPGFVDKEDLWLVELENGKMHLLYDSSGPSFLPEWSITGEHIAFVGHDNEFAGSTSTHLWIINVTEFVKKIEIKGEAKPLTLKDAHNVTRPLDRIVGGQRTDVGYPVGKILGWREDALVFLLRNRGAGLIYQVVPGNPAEEVFKDRELSVSSLAVAREYLAFTASNPMKPEDLYLYRDNDLIQLTSINQELLDQVEVGNWDEYTYRCDDGQEVDGWIIYPTNYDSAKSYPLWLVIHGGPHAAYGPNFYFTVQLFAAQGYIVFYPNPRGSETYGQEFACCIDKDWGNRDYADIMNGVDALIEKGIIDQEQMFAYGWSYGGYMACWIATQTDRFKAICAGASVTNMVSAYGTSDITIDDEYEYGSQPWADSEQLINRSPLKYVQNITTPIMLMHGEKDQRVSVTQSEEFYIALKRLEKEVVMVKYPGESHIPSRPVHKLDRFKRIICWFDYYRDQS